MPRAKHRPTVMGIDPGLATTGYGIIREESDGYRVIDAGVITTDAQLPFGERLAVIYSETRSLLKKHHPAQVGIEQLFFAKNVTTAFTVGQARGVIYLACQQQHVHIHEYTPLQVKQSITGYGKADKTQMQKMIKLLFKLKAIPRPDDMADALAIAVCCAQTKQFHSS